MTFSVSIAAPRDRDVWDTFVDARGDAAGYHAWDWQRVFEQGVRPRARLPDGPPRRRTSQACCRWSQIKSLIFGNTLTSLPFLNYGGVMADDHRRG